MSTAAPLVMAQALGWHRTDISRSKVPTHPFGTRVRPESGNGALVATRIFLQVASRQRCSCVECIPPVGL